MIIPSLTSHQGRRAFKRLSREVPLGLMFEKFHQLLEFNNRVLEIIAEMEEMAEGEYIFDRSYIQRVREPNRHGH